MRDLYEIFRDGVIDDAITSHGGGPCPTPWGFLPKDAHHIGRIQTVALIRRFMQRAAQEFPGGITLTKTQFKVDPMFIEFVKTHRAMGTSYREMAEAWGAMSSIMTEGT